MTAARTLLDKLWDAHLVSAETAETPAVLYVDLHLIHEVTSPQAFASLRERGLKVRRPERTVATMDHSIPTSPLVPAGPEADAQVSALERNCREFGITLYPVGNERQGIVHVIGPELGLTQPGMTIVCGDSHTSTHGALGALAFGIGTSEVGHVLAHAVPAPAQAQGLRVRGGRPPGPGRHRQGPDPGLDRPGRHRRGHRPRHRVPRQRPFARCRWTSA